MLRFGKHKDYGTQAIYAHSSLVQARGVTQSLQAPLDQMAGTGRPLCMASLAALIEHGQRELSALVATGRAADAAKDLSSESRASLELAQALGHMVQLAQGNLTAAPGVLMSVNQAGLALKELTATLHGVSQHAAREHERWITSKQKLHQECAFRIGGATNELRTGGEDHGGKPLPAAPAMSFLPPTPLVPVVVNE